MTLKLITAMTADLFTVAQVQEHLRMSDDEATEMDVTIKRLISDAEAFIEDFTWRALMTQTWDYFLGSWPDERFIVVPRPPLISVTGVYYTPDGESEETLSNTKYLVDIDSLPGRVVLNRDESWPTDVLSPSNPVRVRFVAGHGVAAANVPERIKQAALLHITSNYDGVNLKTVIDNILMNYRVVRW